MKKIKMRMRGILAVLLFFAVIFTGCSSAPSSYVYDESVPLEQSSTLRIRDCFVTNFNGLSTANKNMPWGWGINIGTRFVQIPSGEHTLEIKTAGVERVTSTEITNTLLTAGRKYNFLPGHTYTVYASSDSKIGKPVVIIFDEVFEKHELIPDLAKPATPLEGKWVSTNDETEILTFAGNEFILAYRFGKTTYFNRGFFTLDGRNVTRITVAQYDNKKGEWVIKPGDIWGVEFIYDGTSLKYKTNQRDAYKRLE